MRCVMGIVFLGNSVLRRPRFLSPSRLDWLRLTAPGVLITEDDILARAITRRVLSPPTGFEFAAQHVEPRGVVHSIAMPLGMNLLDVFSSEQHAGERGYETDGGVDELLKGVLRTFGCRIAGGRAVA